jgi:hypothetical protein
MQRLFTFGCSFTQYWRWPTWADALAKQAKQFENWGMCGAGNSFIFNSLVECNQRSGLGPNDQVVIMWTNTSRIDHYVGKRWFPLGNIYWTDGSRLPSDYVKNFACERGFLIRDLAFISAAKNLLEHWGCHWKFLSMVPLGKTNQDIDLGNNPDDNITPDHDVRKLYQQVLESVEPSVFETVFNNQWWSGHGIFDSFDPTRRDFHPTPCEHVEYLNKICPEWPIDQSTQEWMYDWEQKIRNQTGSWHSPNIPTRL